MKEEGKKQRFLIREGNGKRRTRYPPAEQEIRLTKNYKKLAPKATTY